MGLGSVFKGKPGKGLKSPAKGQGGAMAKQPKQNPSGLSLAEIAEAVAKDAKGQLDVQPRLAANDPTIAFELIAVALYRAMRRRGVDHKKALKSTEELSFISDIRVVVK